MNDNPAKPGSSNDPQSNPESATYGRPEKADWRRYARFTLWGIVALIAVFFVLGNTQEVNVSFIFKDATLPMYVVILISMFLGLLIGGGGVWFLSRRKAKEKARIAKGGKK
jgi:uncharacterized integral membrane protein